MTKRKAVAAREIATPMNHARHPVMTVSLRRAAVAKRTPTAHSSGGDRCMTDRITKKAKIGALTRPWLPWSLEAGRVDAPVALKENG
jgi:hypothetical protein